MQDSAVSEQRHVELPVLHQVAPYKAQVPCDTLIQRWLRAAHHRQRDRPEGQLA